MNNPLFHILSDVPSLDGTINFFINAIPYGESLGEIEEMLRKRIDDSSAIIAEKSGQMLALMGIFAAPIVIILFLFIGKIAYDIFTGAADSIGDAFLIAKYKIKTYLKLVFTKIRSLISPSA